MSPFRAPAGAAAAAMREPGVAGQQRNANVGSSGRNIQGPCFVPLAGDFVLDAADAGGGILVSPSIFPLLHSVEQIHVSPVTDALGSCLGSEAAAPSWPLLPHHLSMDAHGCILYFCFLPFAAPLPLCTDLDP